MMDENNPRKHPHRRPLKDGVIADFNAAELMITGADKLVYPKKPLFPPSWPDESVFLLHYLKWKKELSGIAPEKQAGAKEVYLLHEPNGCRTGYRY